MRRAGVAAIVLLVSLCAVAEKTSGIKPRGKVTEYAAVQENNDLAIGVAQLTAKQVRRQFVSNIGKNYVVIEIGVFPKSETQISPQDFTLHAVEGDQSIDPADPKEMATTINTKDQAGTDVDIYPVQGIEYRSGTDPRNSEPRISDPQNDGRTVDRSDRTSGGWTTYSGVDAVIHDRQKTPATSQADQKAMTAELSEQSLPDTRSGKPIAGYLFFDAQAKPGAKYELRYNGANGKMMIPLTVPAN